MNPIPSAIERAGDWLLSECSPKVDKAKPTSKLYYSLGLSITSSFTSRVTPTEVGQIILSNIAVVVERERDRLSIRDIILALLACRYARNSGTIKIGPLVQLLQAATKLVIEKTKPDPCDVYLSQLLLEMNGRVPRREEMLGSRQQLLSELAATFSQRKNPLDISKDELLIFCKYVFALTEFGTKSTPTQSGLHNTVQYLRYLTFYHTKNRDIDLVCPLLLALKYLGAEGCWEYSSATEYLLNSQNQDGSFGLYEIELYLDSLAKDDVRNRIEDIYLPVTVLASWSLATLIGKVNVI